MTNTIAQAHCRWDDFFEFNPASRHRRRIILKLIRNLAFKSIMDAGCANGQLLDFLQNQIGVFRSPSFRLAGADLNRPETPELIRELHGSFYQLDLEKDALMDKFDLVVASEVLEHIRNDRKAVDHLARMTGRWILLTVPAGNVYPSDMAMGHVRHYTGESLRRLMEESGFRTISCFAWGFPFHSLYRILLNRASGHILSHFGKARYSFWQKALCDLLTATFYLNLRGAGQQLFYLGERR